MMVLEESMINDTTLENEDLHLDACFKEYIQEFVRKGHNLTSLDHAHVIECCNGTFPYNCSIPSGTKCDVEC